MTQAASNYKSELDQFTLILKKLEQSLLSTKQKLQKEVEKNKSLNQEIFTLREKIPSHDHSKENELEMALKQLEIAQNQSVLFKEELDKTREKLNRKIAENHQLDILNKHLQSQKDAYTSPVSKISPVTELPTTPIVHNEEKIQELQEKLLQQEKENEHLQKQLSQTDSQVFSKEEVTELFLQEKIFAKELENKEKEKRQIEECKASFNAEKEQLYDELIAIAKTNQEFISRLSQLKEKEQEIKSIKDRKND